MERASERIKMFKSSSHHCYLGQVVDFDDGETEMQGRKEENMTHSLTTCCILLSAVK